MDETDMPMPSIPSMRLVESAQWGDSHKFGIIAVINGNTCTVPVDEFNMDYQAILAWVEAGNVIADPPVTNDSEQK